MTAVTLRVPKALAEIALQRPFRSVVHLHLFSETAEIVERTHFRDIRAKRHRRCELWYEGTVVIGVLIPSPRLELHDGLHMEVQGLQLLSNLCFGHVLA
jgi:hypothetical protein